MKSEGKSTMAGKAAADSAVRSSPGLRRLAGLVEVICALASVIPR